MLISLLRQLLRYSQICVQKYKKTVKDMQPIPIITSDGSHSLFVPGINEHYHSVNGAIQESLHVYITAGLNECSKINISVLEIGFGTGLNAFLTFLEAEKRNLNIEYFCLEKYPLDEDITVQLNYASILSPQHQNIFEKLHSSSWENTHLITPFFSLKKINADINTYHFDNQNFDVVYYDAFAPDKQPEVWNPDIFRKIYTTMNPGGIITTYCAKGAVRRMLQSVGFKTERIPGPPGKREMLRGRGELKTGN